METPVETSEPGFCRMIPSAFVLEEKMFLSVSEKQINC